jgi:hypothetical protein
MIDIWASKSLAPSVYGLLKLTAFLSGNHNEDEYNNLLGCSRFSFRIKKMLIVKAGNIFAQPNPRIQHNRDSKEMLDWLGKG